VALNEYELELYVRQRLARARGETARRAALTAAREVPMRSFTIRSREHDQVIDITDRVAAEAAAAGGEVCTVFVPHTTCALTVLTGERGIADDLLGVLRTLVSQTATYVHDSANHVRAHVLSALVGPSVALPLTDGRLGLGQFQRVVLLEFEGPRERTVQVSTHR